MSGLTRAELSALAGVDEEVVARVVEHGIVEPDGGAFAPGDAQRVRLAAAFEDAGIPLERIAHGIEVGELDFSNLDHLFGAPSPVTDTTYGELAASHGRDFELLARIVLALGLPRPAADDRVRRADAEALAPFLAGWELLDEAEVVRFVRIYGDAVRTAAESVVRLFQATVSARVATLDEPARAQARRVGTTAAAMLEAVERLLVWANRRHIEHYVFETSVAATEAELEQRGELPPRVAHPPAIAFLDLTGYTALTEERGDESAAELAARLGEVVEDVAAANGGRPVKWLGDGVMFHFPEPAGAVHAGLDLVRRTPRLGLPPSRVGVNAGPVIFRDGDYFGRTVNLAARIADYARPGEVLVTEPVCAAADGEAEFEPLHPVPLKGLSGTVPLFRARERRTAG